MTNSNLYRDLYKLLTQKANQKAVFTSAELRETLGLLENSAEAQRVHNKLQQLLKDRIIETVKDGRKRHKHLRVDLKKVADLERLQGRLARRDTPNTASSSSPSSAPKRVLELERRFEELRKENEERFTDLTKQLAAVSTKLDGLVDLWS